MSSDKALGCLTGMVLNETLNSTTNPQDKSVRVWGAFFIMLIALTGHTLVFLALYCQRRLRTIPNLIILNLRVADFLFSSIVFPVHVVRLLHGQTSMTGASCYITGVASMLFCLASINTLTFISIERYMATNYPIQHRHRFDFKLVKIVLASIWCWSALLSGLPFFTSHYVFMERFFHCSPDWSHDLGTTVTFVLLGIALPQIVLVYCNVHIIRAIRKSRKIHEPVSSNGPSRGSQDARYLKERRMSLVTFAVVVAFLICWAPYCVAMVCLVSGKCRLPEDFMVLALMLSALNSCCNPIIYGVLNKNFRHAFKNILCCKRTEAIGNISAGFITG